MPFPNSIHVLTKQVFGACFLFRKVGKKELIGPEKNSNGKLMPNELNYELNRGKGKEVKTFLKRSGEKIMTNASEEKTKQPFPFADGYRGTVKGGECITFCKMCLDEIKGFLTFRKGSC